MFKTHIHKIYSFLHFILFCIKNYKNLWFILLIKKSAFDIQNLFNYHNNEIKIIKGIAGVINQKDVELIVRAQKKMLQRFEKTNEMLTNVNSLSATRYC